MAQLNLFTPETPSTLTVAQLTRSIRDRLETDPALQDLWVSGEVSNASRPASGHLYLTLKDSSAAIKCVMWKPQALRLRFLPRDGDAVEIHGSIGVYEAGGAYQLYADDIRAAGQGSLHLEYLRLKDKLEAEGLFDPARQQPIPAWPRRIGLVTSPTGAALQDILNTLRRRFPLLEVILAPTAVQGPEAPDGISRSLQTLAAIANPDVIIVARGGGSIEDLWAFNDERVVRAIAACAIPIITGIGHETDFTLSDFAADLRAPTPTAAAELATPDQAEIQQMLAGTSQYLTRTLDSLLARHNRGLNDLRGRLLRQSPTARLRNDRQRLDDLARRMGTATRHGMRMHATRVNAVRSRLEGVNPLSVLARGFAVVTDPAGQVIRSVGQVQPGKALTVRVADGSFGAYVSETSEVSKTSEV